MHPLKNYIKFCLKKGYKKQAIRQILLQSGWPEDNVRSGFKAARPKFRILFLLIPLILVLGISSLYFTVVSPINVPKPVVEKPTIVEYSQSENTQNLSNQEEKAQQITGQYVVYLLNEIGGYNLHSDPTSKSVPEIEFYISDIGRIYSVTVENNKLIASLSSPKNPDVKLTMDSDILLSLIKSENLQDDVLKDVEDKKIYFEPLVDYKVLVLKGYKAIYDSLN